MVCPKRWRRWDGWGGEAKVDNKVGLVYDSKMAKHRNLEDGHLGVDAVHCTNRWYPRLPSISVSNAWCLFFEAELMKGMGFGLTKPSSAGSAKTRAPNAEIRDSTEKEKIEYPWAQRSSICVRNHKRGPSQMILPIPPWNWHFMNYLAVSSSLNPSKSPWKSDPWARMHLTLSNGSRTPEPGCISPWATFASAEGLWALREAGFLDVNLRCAKLVSVLLNFQGACAVGCTILKSP